MKNQLRELVAATRHFLEQKSPRYDFWGQFKTITRISPAALSFSKEIKPAPSERASHREAETIAHTEPPPTTLKPKSPPKNTPPAAQYNTKSVWELQAMPFIIADSAIEALKKKMAAFIPLIEPEISVLLALSEEFSNHRLFLESLSKAITRAFASASVVLFSDELLSPSSRPLLIVTPLVLIQKKYPQAQIHTVLKEGNLSLLPLDHLDRYQNDQTSKRSLWTVIQHLFQSL